jgi:cbb3-type cytochrome oxidase subunit 3
MKLSDVMSSMGLAIYAEVALLIFFAVFIAVVAWVLAKRNRSRWEQARYMPLDDETPQSARRLEGDPKS